MAEKIRTAEGRRAEAERLRLEGVPLNDRGQHAEALAVFDAALAAAHETGDEAFVDWIYACRSTAAVETGSADAEFLELKRILLRSTDPGTSFRAAYNIARVCELRKDLKKALFYNRIALQHASALPGEPLLAIGAANQSGMLLVADSRFGEAAETYRTAWTSARENGGVSQTVQAIIQDNLGYCLMALDLVPDGLALVHDSFEQLERTQSPGLTVFPLLDLCFGYLKLDRYAEARYFGEAGLERVELVGEKDLEKNFLYLLGETCHLSGDSGAAEGYFDRLAAHYPEFRNLRAYLDVFDFRNVINLRG